MRRIFTIACVLAMICGGSQAQPSAQAADNAPAQKTSTLRTRTRRPASSRVRAKKLYKAAPVPAASAQPAPAPVTPAPVPAAPSRPPAPSTLMNSQPVPPAVAMNQGLLTIDAPNSTLADVLHEVQKATGAEVEGALPTERIAVRLGPGDPREVIAALLQGTPYDYVILGSPENPDAVTHIVLSQSTPASASAGSASPNAPGANAAIGRPPFTRAPELPPQPQETEDTPTPQPAVAETDSDQPAQQPQPASQQAAASQGQPNTGQPNTPEQLFRQLQGELQARPQNAPQSSQEPPSN